MNSNGKVKQCSNGPGCRFLGKGSCKYFHPNWHINERKRQQKKKQQKQRKKEIIQKVHKQNNLPQRSLSNEQNEQNETHENQNMFRTFRFDRNESNPSFSRFLQNARDFRASSVYRQNYDQFQRGLNGVRRQRSVLRGTQGERVRLMRIMEHNQPDRSTQVRVVENQVINPQKQDDLDWFFERNKKLSPDQLSLRQLQLNDQCPICYDAINLVQQRQNIHHEDNKYSLEQLSSCSYKSLNPFQFLQVIQESQKPKFTYKQLTRLYCDHIFHSQCIKQWLKLNPQCAICRKDFREHEKYAQWDTEYKKRIVAMKKSRPGIRPIDWVMAIFYSRD